MAKLPRSAALHTTHYAPNIDTGTASVQIGFNRRSPDLDDMLVLADHLADFLAQKKNCYFRVRSARAQDSLLSSADHLPDIRTCYLEGESRGRRYVAFVLETGFTGDSADMMPTAFVHSRSYEWQDMPRL